MSGVRQVPIPGHRRARALAVAAASAAAALTVALSQLGGSYALFAAEVGLGGGSMSSGTAAVALTGTIPATYSSSTLSSAVANLRISNTGDAPLELSLGWTAESGALDADAVSLRIWANPGTTAASCGTAPTDAAMGTLSSPNTGSLLAPALAPGDARELCADTSVTSSQISAEAGKSLAGHLVVSGSWGSWLAAAAGGSFDQSVSSPSEVFYSNPSPRYNILNANSCVSARGGTSTVVRSGICDYDHLGQFRIASDGNGRFFISAAKNSSSQPSAPRWSLSATAGNVTLATVATTAAQRWAIEQRPDGLYRFVNEATGSCATVTAVEIWSGGGHVLSGAACDDALASQGFSFTMIDNPVVTPYALGCTFTHSGYVTYTWNTIPGYQQEIAYRVWVGSVVVPTGADGYNAYAQLYSRSGRNLVTAGVGLGTHQVVVEQQIAGSQWTTVATGTLVVTPPAGNNVYDLACG